MSRASELNSERLLSPRVSPRLVPEGIANNWRRETQLHVLAAANYWRASVLTISKLMSFMLVLGCASALAADRPADNTTKTPSAQGQATPRADNTGINARDKSGDTKTPQNQTNNEADRKLLAAVRRAVVDDKTLSNSAHNVKIVTKDGVVTLRGPVTSEDEKSKVAKIAQQVVGVASVENQLDVKTK
jgi:hyperosmotically inducible periplasmic protein